jgi:hypothetical protein
MILEMNSYRLQKLESTIFNVSVEVHRLREIINLMKTILFLPMRFTIGETIERIVSELPMMILRLFMIMLM